MLDLHNKRWVYYLNETQPDLLHPRCFRVSIVVENETGHYPTGGEGQFPWYWDKETCEQANRERGFNPEQALEIVCSSMFVDRPRYRRVRQ